MIDHLTLCMSYYDQPEMFKEQCRNWMSWSDESAKKLTIVLSDDCSKIHPLVIPDELREKVGKVVHLRVLDDIPWNDMGSRNLCFKHAEGWCYAMDQDHLLREDSFKALMATHLDRPRVYHLKCRLANNPAVVMTTNQNMYVIHRDDFWGVGGYCEEFAGGYGYSDSLLFKTIETLTGLHAFLLDIWLEHYTLGGIPSQFPGGEGVIISDGSVFHLDRSLTRNMPIWQALKKLPADDIVRRATATRLKFKWELVK